MINYNGCHIVMTSTFPMRCSTTSSSFSLEDTTPMTTPSSTNEEGDEEDQEEEEEEEGEKDDLKSPQVRTSG